MAVLDMVSREGEGSRCNYCVSRGKNCSKEEESTHDAWLERETHDQNNREKIRWQREGLRGVTCDRRGKLPAHRCAAEEKLNLVKVLSYRIYWCSVKLC